VHQLLCHGAKDIRFTLKSTKPNCATRSKFEVWNCSATTLLSPPNSFLLLLLLFLLFVQDGFRSPHLPSGGSSLPSYASTIPPEAALSRSFVDGSRRRTVALTFLLLTFLPLLDIASPEIFHGWYLPHHDDEYYDTFYESTDESVSSFSVRIDREESATSPVFDLLLAQPRFLLPPAAAHRRLPSRSRVRETSREVVVGREEEHEREREVLVRRRGKEIIERASSSFLPRRFNLLASNKERSSSLVVVLSGERSF